MDYDVRIISSMEKVLPLGGMQNSRLVKRIIGFLGQRVSFQVAYCFHGDYYLNQTLKQAFRNPYAHVKAEGDFPGKVTIRKVDCVPVFMPHEKQNKKYDSEYIGHEAGLYPDILSPFEDGVQVVLEQWRALWIDCEIPEDLKGGDYTVSFIFSDNEGMVLAQPEVTIHVVPASLPKQKFLHTEWFYPDCLADYYGVEVYSEEHWNIIEAYLRLAFERGINVAYTPILTPALDTLIGKDRTTVQLVKIKMTEGRFEFDFGLLRRWIRLCREIGFEFFEMAHLFAQWGAKYPPKVMAEVDGKSEKIFGWHTPVESCGYDKFLAEFLPELVKELKELGVFDNTIFHVSDEPTIYNADTYQKALQMVEPYLEGAKIIDALSHLDLYEKGIVKNPVPTNDSIHQFLDAGLKNGWVYYCCGQGYKVSNRYIAMPGWRTRILGAQLYKYKMEGFLHWGYNFYNCQYSLHTIDPYRINDGEDAFPAGDPFIVYPGADGKPVESMRLPVMEDAMNDMRLLEYLESLTSREHVLDLIDDYGNLDLRFDEYPSGCDYLQDLWETAAKEVEELIK